MKKKLLVIVLSLSLMLLGGSSIVSANGNGNQKNSESKVNKSNRVVQNVKEFKDVQNDWSREEVMEAYAKGFVNGYDDFTFRPNSSVSKLETIVLIINALGLEEKAQDYDLSAEEETLLKRIPDWGKAYVALALQNGILMEEELSGFNPQQAAKRFEVCLYISRILGNDELTVDLNIDTFTDEETIPNDSKNAIHKMKKIGVISGYPDGTFQPMKAVKRNELITILNHLDDNYLQIFEQSTIKGTVEAIKAADDGYTITVKLSSGDTVDVNTNNDTVMTYHGHSLTSLDNVGDSLKVKILLNQDEEAVFVRFMDADDEEAIEEEIVDEAEDELDELDEVDEISNHDQTVKNHKTNNGNKHGKSTFTDELADELADELDAFDGIDEIN